MLQCVHLLFKNHIYVIYGYIHTYQYPIGLPLIKVYIHTYIHTYTDTKLIIYMYEKIILST